MPTKEAIQEEFSTLEANVIYLKEQVKTLENSKNSLEAQLTSLRYQLDGERKQMLIGVDNDRKKRFDELQRLESEIRTREFKAVSDERRLAELRVELDKELIAASQVTEQEKKFNMERLQLDRLRREIETLSTEAQSKFNEANEIIKVYKEQIDGLKLRENGIVALEELLQKRSDELELKSIEVSTKISHYEKLKEFIEDSDKKEGIK